MDKHNNNIIKVENIVKSYRLYNKQSDRIKEVFHPTRKKYHHKFRALDQVSFEVKKGETIGIVGRNGSGKSTLLQIICGILRPNSGNIFVNGKVSALLELGAGFNPSFTGRQNVYINSAILGLSEKETESCFEDIVDFAGIGEFIDQPVKTYSSGMYIRLAFAVAVNVKPEILIVDEALSVGDIQFQSKCFAKFKEFQEKKITILFVTHALDLITRYCTRAILLDEGMIRTEGNPKDVVDEYNRLIVNSSKNEDASHKEKAENKNIQLRQSAKNNTIENRYGNGKAEIIEAGIFSKNGDNVENLISGDTYSFKMKVKFNEKIHEPVFAYTVKDVKGFDISGTNTLFKEINTGTLEKGEIVLVSFEQKILLNPGGYLISFGCVGFDGGKYVVYERRYDFMTFEVISTQGTVGFFDMDSIINISKIFL